MIDFQHRKQQSNREDHKTRQTIRINKTWYCPEGSMSRPKGSILLLPVYIQSPFRPCPCGYRRHSFEHYAQCTSKMIIITRSKCGHLLKKFCCLHSGSPLRPTLSTRLYFRSWSYRPYEFRFLRSTAVDMLTWPLLHKQNLPNLNQECGIWVSGAITLIGGVWLLRRSWTASVINHLATRISESWYKRFDMMRITKLRETFCRETGTLLKAKWCCT